jgi:hypothetical protein
VSSPLPLQRGDDVELAQRVIATLQERYGRLHVGRSKTIMGSDGEWLDDKAERLAAELAGTPVASSGKPLRMSATRIRAVVGVMRTLLRGR